jgi:transcriptional regulator with XRE-family HTH domain
MLKIGKTIAMYRKAHGYLQNHVAEKVGVTQNFLSQIETNHKRASLDVVEKICEFYKIPVSVFFTDVENCEDNKKEE